MSKQTLYGVLDDFNSLWSLIEERNGDITGFEEELEVFENELVANLRSKADGYARVISECNAIADAIKAEKVRLTKLANSQIKKAEKLKQMLRYAMETTNNTKFETDFHKFAIQKNGGKRPLDIRIPAERLPAEYKITLIEPDKEAIRRSLKAGKTIDGITLMEAGTSLRIR